MLPLLLSILLSTGTSDEIEAISELIRSARYAEAENAARSALESRESAERGETLEAAMLMTQLATAIDRQGRTGEGEGIPLVRRAIEIRRKESGERSPEVATSLMQLGTLHWRIGDYDAARPPLERSIEILESLHGEDHLEVVKPVENLAILLWSTGDYPRARSLLERSLTIREREMDPGDVLIAQTCNNLAILHWQLGDYEGARGLYERALRIRESQENPDPGMLADVVDNLAMTLERLGETDGAHALYERALSLRKALGPDHPFVALSLLRVGGVQRQLGEFEEARRSLERAVEINVKAYGEEHTRVGNALNELAVLLIEMGQHEEALVVGRRALRVQEASVGRDHIRVARCHQVLARANRALGHHAQAANELARALEITETALGPDHPAVADILVELALLRLVTKDPGLGREELQRALAIRETQLGTEHPSVAGVLTGLARLDWLEGKVADARRRAERADRISDRALRRTLGALPEKHALYLASRQPRPESILYSGLVAATNAQRRPWLEASWNCTLRNRGTVLEALATRQEAARDHPSGEVRRALESLGEARRRLAALWIRGVGEKDPESYRELLAQAERQKRAAEKELGRLASERQVPGESPLTLSDLLPVLPPESAVVEVVRVTILPPASLEGELHDVALLITPDGGLDFVDLGPAARLDALTRRWRDELAAGVEAIVDERGRESAEERIRTAGEALRRSGWDPVAARIEGARQVYLVPDGALHRVDPNALPTDSARYLIESGPAVRLLSTARDLARAAGTSGAPPGRGVLAVGRPDFDSASEPLAGRTPVGERIALRSARAGCDALVDKTWADLPQSGREVRQIAESVPDGETVSVLTGAQASEALFKRSAPGRRILHVATHGYFLQDSCESIVASDDSNRSGHDLHVAGENPLLLSGLVLAGANRAREIQGDLDDGILSAEELAALDLRGVELAVLSACDTGRGTVAIGEGVFGLRRALELAGVETVLMSLWRIPDREARLWMKQFYGELFGGTPAALATRRASLHALERLRNNDRWTHPYLWAGFVLVGAR